MSRVVLRRAAPARTRRNAEIVEAAARLVAAYVVDEN